MEEERAGANGTSSGDRVLILIPAKEHSERVPGKNLRKVGGRTLLDWALERAVDSGLGPVTVSTDSDDISASVARSIWYKDNRVTLIMRPKELADKRVTEVCRHALRFYLGVDSDASGFYLGADPVDTLILTLPTSPFITYMDLQLAYRQFVENGRKTLFCVRKLELAETIIMRKIFGGDLILRSSLADIRREYDDHGAYVDVGGMVIMDVARFLEHGDYYAEGMRPWQGYEVDALRAVDIDTEADLLWADYLAREVLPSYGG